MTQIVRATKELFEPAYLLLSGLSGSRCSKDCWRNIFEPRLPSPFDHCGYALMDGKEMAGFIGTIFSERTLDGRKTVVCNITSWFVKEQYRSQSLSLLFPILNLKDCLLTNLTPTDTVSEILLGFDFKPLDARRVIFLPFLPLSAFLPGGKPSLITEPGAVQAALNPRDLRFFKDHRKYNCSHVVFRKDGAYCYIIFNRTVLKGLPFCQLHYCSDPAFFARHAGYIKFELFSLSRAPFIMAEPRILGGTAPGISVTYTRAHPPLYRAPEGVKPPADNLYTELLALNL